MALDLCDPFDRRGVTLMPADPTEAPHGTACLAVGGIRTLRILY